MRVNTVLSVKEKSLKEFYPCPNEIGEVLHNLIIKLSSTSNAQPDSLDNVLYVVLISKIRQLSNKSRLSEYIDRLITDFGIAAFSLSWLDYLNNIDIKLLEALISCIHQTKCFRYHETNIFQNKRKKEGVFFTPLVVAKQMAREACCDVLRAKESSKNDAEEIGLHNGKLLSIRIIDPACGSGILLSSICDLLHDEYRTQFKKQHSSNLCIMPPEQFMTHLIEHGIYGIDRNSDAVRLTKYILHAKYLPNDHELPSNITEADALNLILGKFSGREDFKLGFDVLVMNPPYERLKVDKSDYIDLDNDLYQKHVEETKRLIKNVRASDYFLLSSHGVLDLYKLFVNLSLHLVKQGGSICFIVPMTILGDKSTHLLRKSLFEEAQVRNIYCIPEKARLFYGVTQAFTIMSLSKVRPREPIKLFKNVRTMPCDTNEAIQITSQSINRISRFYSTPLVDNIGYQVTEKIHRFPKISDYANIINLRGELDLTFFSDCVEKKGEVVLLRGNDIDCFRLKTCERSYVDFERFLRKKNKCSTQYIQKERVVLQQISNIAQQKRLKCVIDNSSVLANSCNFILVDSNCSKSLSEPWCELSNTHLLGLLNSFILNWRFNVTSTNNHINNYELDDLPIPAKIRKNEKLFDDLAAIVKIAEKSYSDKVMAMIDLIVSRIYDLTTKEIRYVMESQNYSTNYIDLVLNENNSKSYY